MSHLDDMVKLCDKTCSARFSAFLSEAHTAIAARYMEHCGWKSFMLYGGYEGAQRNILGVFPDYEIPSEESFPIRIVRISSRGADKLSHRDYLGGILSLGIERDQTGDIVCDEGGAYAMLLPAAADMAIMQIEKIGRVGVSCTEAKGSKIVRNDKFSEISGTVSSLRLDSVVSTALRLSREKAAALIRSGSVSVNHGTTESVSEIISSGDILSVRGYGRFILAEAGERTKKDRIHITVKKYL